MPALRRWPSVYLIVRVFFGAYADLNELLLPGLLRFWPRKALWPNAQLFLVWDDHDAHLRGTGDWLGEAARQKH